MKLITSYPRSHCQATIQLLHFATVLLSFQCAQLNPAFITVLCEVVSSSSSPIARVSRVLLLPVTRRGANAQRRQCSAMKASSRLAHLDLPLLPTNRCLTRGAVHPHPAARSLSSPQSSRRLRLVAKKILQIFLTFLVTSNI
jgi:hypothetical protein